VPGSAASLASQEVFKDRVCRSWNRQIDGAVRVSLTAGLYVGVRVEFADATTRAADPRNFADWFLLSGFLALPVLLLTVALNAVSVAVTQLFLKRRHYRSVRHAVVDNVLGGLGYAFVNPYDGLRLGLDTDETGIHRVLSKAWRIFHFCWAIALIAYLALGCIAVW
jgi:hypothetical protein